MLVVKIELWPGGDPAYAEEIGCMALANVSDLSSTSDYLVVAADDSGTQVEHIINGHRREHGFWPLLAAAAAHAGRDRLARNTMGLAHVNEVVVDVVSDEHASTIAAMWAHLRDSAVGLYRRRPR